MALKQPKFAREAQLPTNAYAELQDPANKKSHQVAATQLTQVFAALLDAIAKGEVTHVTLGLPRNRKAFLVTVNYDGDERMFVGGASLVDLAAQLATELLDETGGTGEGL